MEDLSMGKTLLFFFLFYVSFVGMYFYFNLNKMQYNTILKNCSTGIFF